MKKSCGSHILFLLSLKRKKAISPGLDQVWQVRATDVRREICEDPGEIYPHQNYIIPQNLNSGLIFEAIMNIIPQIFYQVISIGMLLVAWGTPYNAFAVKAHNSWHHLPSSNGYCTIAYNANQQVIDCFQPYIFSQWNDSFVIPNLLERAGFLVQYDNKESNLSRIPIEQLGYINGTGIVRVQQRYSSLELISYFWAPMILEFRVAMMVLHVKDAIAQKVRPEDVQVALRAKARFESIRISRYVDNDLWVAEVLLYPGGLDAEMIKQIRDEVSSANPLRLVEAEQRWWNHWHRSGKVPSSIIGREYELLIQSATFIKMAQCLVKGPCQGQIVASLPPGQKNLAYVRDMAYSVVALSRMGHFTEARKALEFMLKANSGKYKELSYGGKNFGVGVPYQISGCRYFGNGTENIPKYASMPCLCLDGFGLFLWATQDFVKQSTDLEFAKNFWPIIDKGVAIPLAAAITKDGLIRAESGIWERPLPGRQHLFTSASAYAGFNAAAFLAFMVDDRERTALYSRAAARIRKGILYHLTDEKRRIYKGSLEVVDFPQHLDAASVECINWGISKPEWKVSRATMDAFEENLRRADGSGGFAGKVGTIGKPESESVFIDLRVVAALNKMRRRVQAKKLMNWVIEQATQNYDIIPEKYSWKEANYSGAVPSIGLGAGAYVIAVMGE